MKKTWLFMTAALALLGGCNNFFHELVPPDDNRILSFTVLNQLEETRIGENSLTALVSRETDLTALVPEIGLPARASILPLTLDYVSAAFPEADLLRTAMEIYSTDDLTAYVIELIKANPGFNVPPISAPIDFTGPVELLVISGMGSIRRYTAHVSIDTGTAQIIHLGFSKYDNPLLMFDAVGFLDEETKTIGMLAVFPAELDPAYSLIPDFELLGDSLEADGLNIRPGIDALTFEASLNSPPPSLYQTKTLTVHRAGYPSSSYTLSLLSREDPDTIRSITDFRFTKADNPGIIATTVASIVNNGDRGIIRIQVLYRGAKPTALKARYVSPGTVTVGGVSQTSGLTVNDFSGPPEYRVVSRNGLYTRTYRVETEFIDASDLAPKLLSFRFPSDLNGELAQTAVGEISEGAGVVLIDVKYTGASVPRNLIPEFSATGLVKAAGLTQTSGSGGQDFTRRIKYTVVSPDDPNFYRDYWVQTVFTRDDSAAAAITAFSFHPDENPHLADEAAARIDQTAGTIYVYLPPGTNIGSVPLVPRFSAYGKVTVEGLLQTSGSGGRLFDQPVVYSAESANGLNRKDYTVTVQELNTRIYVDKDAAGHNNGVSWADAFINLRSACEAAALFPDHVPREIWIAEGTYTPSLNGNPADYLPLTPNTAYIGGFAGWETGKGQRNPAANPVIISGDLGGARSRHLFYGTSLPNGELVFEDLTFTAAKTPEGAGWQDYNGAAVSLTAGGGTVRVKGCAFTDLEADCYGGALYINGMGLDLRSSRFESCRVLSSGNLTLGGAVYVELPNQAAAVNVDQVTFDSTEARNGGAVHIQDNYAHNNAVNFSQVRLEAVSSISSGGIHVGGYRNAVTMSDITINKTTTVTSNTHSGIYVVCSNGGTVDISDAELYNAGIYSSTGNGITYLDDMTVSNSQNFTNDHIELYGGADISGVTVEGTWPASGSGAVSISSSPGQQGVRISRLTVNNITDNRGLYIANGSTEPTVISGLHISNTTTSDQYYGGGGAYIRVEHGGDISIGNNGSSLIEDRNIISGTQSASDGGGLSIFSYHGTMLTSTVISGLDIRNTTASGSGGGACIYVSSSLLVEDVAISGTRAAGSGGGLYMWSWYPENPMEISGLDINDTAALLSGGGAVLGANNLIIRNYTSTKTRAWDGGSLFVGRGNYSNNLSSFKIMDSVITDSWAECPNVSNGFASGGGGISERGHKTVEISNVTFCDVKAFGAYPEIAGGAILFNPLSSTNSHQDIKITGGSIKNAESNKFGGAIAVVESANTSCIIDGVDFLHCSAPQGSLLYGYGWGMIYTVKTNCSVDGGSTLDPSMWCLENGANIIFSP